MKKKNVDECNTRGKEALATARKKKSPSTLGRNARRREQLLGKKLNAPDAVSSSHSEQVSEKEAESPVLEAPEKERLPPPISDRSQFLGREGRNPPFFFKTCGS